MMPRFANVLLCILHALHSCFLLCFISKNEKASKPRTVHYLIFSHRLTPRGRHFFEAARLRGRQNPKRSLLALARPLFASLAASDIVLYFFSLSKKSYPMLTLQTLKTEAEFCARLWSGCRPIKLSIEDITTTVTYASP